MRIEKNNLTRGAVLIATGVILPTIFHSFNMGGQVFLPMHIPVLLAGFLLSPMYAAIVGFSVPLLSLLFTGMPPMPSALVMMLELLTYGWVAATLYGKYLKNIYAVMLFSMIAGRMTSLIGNYLLLEIISGKGFSLAAYLKTVTFVALPGIAIQLVLIPALVALLIKHENIDLVQDGEKGDCYE